MNPFADESNQCQSGTIILIHTKRIHFGPPSASETIFSYQPSHCLPSWPGIWGSDIFIVRAIIYVKRFAREILSIRSCAIQVWCVWVVFAAGACLKRAWCALRGWFGTTQVVVSNNTSCTTPSNYTNELVAPLNRRLTSTCIYFNSIVCYTFKFYI